MLKQYQHIQVAVDGSKEADVAFSKAVEVAKRNGATLEILHVVDTRAFQDVSSFDSAMVEQVSEEAKTKIEEYYNRAKDAGVKDVHYSIEFGSPKNIIAHEFPEEHNIDLIQAADYLIDMGPGGGSDGGRIIACGTLDDIMQCNQSVTGKYFKKRVENEK